MKYQRGSIFYADLGSGQGSEQGGTRPVLIIQNDTGNKHSPTVIVAAITSKQTKAKLPTHVAVQAHSFGIERDSIIMMEQVRTIDKKRLKEKIGGVDSDTMESVDKALAISVGLSA